MKKLISFILFISTFTLIYAQSDTDSAANEKIEVSGVVSDKNGPLPKVLISEKGTDNNTISDRNGRFNIKARKGGLLQFQHIGKELYFQVVGDNKTINVVLENKNEDLGEVVITADSEGKSEAINTGNKVVDKRKLGYAVESISSEDISQLDTDVKQAVKGQFSGLYIQNDTANDDVDLSQFIGRGNNMSLLLSQYGLIVIDGVPISQTDPGLVGDFGTRTSTKGISSHINPDNIANITYLKGLAATNKYGTLGRNGVLLITTKTASSLPSDRARVKKKTVVKLGTTPTYLGDSFVPNSLLANTSYIKELEKTQDVEAARKSYQNAKLEFGSEPMFYINTASYFTKWRDPALIEEILDEVTELENTKDSDLLAQAYLYEKAGLMKKAISVYQKLIERSPEKLQNYRNLALMFKKDKQLEKSKEAYLQLHSKLTNASVDVTELKKSSEIEFKNLYALNSSVLNIDRVPSKYLENKEFDTRIVFEWNEFDSEFEIQIVNPQNRYFTWSHSSKEDKQRLKREEKSGFGMEEFFLTKDDKGKWLFNINYLGKKKGDNRTPTYLKVTTYKNYGKPVQTEEVKVIALDEMNKKLSVISIEIE